MVEELVKFKCRVSYGQAITVDALAIEACEEELILGLDFLKRTRAVMNQATGELTFDDDDEVTLPFTCCDEDTGLNRPGVVRLVKRRVGCEQRVNVRLQV